MDADATLHDLRELVEQIRERRNTIPDSATYSNVHELLDHFAALDSHLSQGGAPPEEWTGPDAHPEHVYVPPVRREPPWIWMDTEYVVSIVRIRENHDRNNQDLTDETPEERDEIMHIHAGEVGIRFTDEQGRAFILAGEVDAVRRATRLADQLAERAQAERSRKTDPLGPVNPAGAELPEATQ